MNIKKFTKIAISVVYYVCVTALRIVRDATGGKHDGARLVILYYHGVSIDERTRFAKQLDTIIRYSTTVHPDYHGPGIENGLHVAITFDDAFENLLSNAIPELLTRSLPATIFAPSGNLGSDPKWSMQEVHKQEADRIMTGEQLATIASDTIQIGSHTVSHPRLSTVDTNQLMYEIDQSKKDLEALLGRPVSTLSFPYGDYDERVLLSAKESGYKFVYTISPEVVNTSSTSVARGRVATSPSDGAFEFYLKMVGAYSWMPYASKIKKNFSIKK